MSNKNGIIDFIDLIIGSEGILGMIASCQLGLDENPKNRLELFISLDSESEAIDFHDFLNNHLNHYYSKQ